MVYFLVACLCQYGVAADFTENELYNTSTGRFLRRASSMELLVLALGGIAGAALLLTPSSPLPSEKEFNAAKEKLQNSPEDPDANTIVGKYIAFVTGDYESGMKYLAKSGDKTLRTLAEHENAPLYTDTAAQKVGMGDEWVAAGKAVPALFRIFYDRASYWYTAAWSDLDPLWKTKVRERAMKLAAARPAGAARKGIPTGWNPNPATAAWMRLPVLDGTISHTGSYSMKMIPADNKAKNYFSQLLSELVPISGKEIEYSAYVMSNDTENAGDKLYVDFFDKGGTWLGWEPLTQSKIPVDAPFWVRLSAKGEIPKDAAQVRFTVIQNSKTGNVWVDEASIRVDGKEVLKNGSFEGK